MLDTNHSRNNLIETLNTSLHEHNITSIQIISSAKLPTKYGEFTIIGFLDTVKQQEHTALMKGNINGKTNVLVRVHSECLTGDTFGSLRCDCGDQLSLSLQKISEYGEGILIYLRQEGRGIGLLNKIKAYHLQDQGYDTIEANILLGFKPDERDFSPAAALLKALNISSIKLMTNNPKKIHALEEHGIIITERIPLLVPPNQYNQHYLLTKQVKAHHLLNLSNTPLTQEKEQR